MAVAVFRLNGLIARYRPTCSITTPVLLQPQAYHKKRGPPLRGKSPARVPATDFDGPRAPHPASKEGISARSTASDIKPTCRECARSFAHFNGLSKHVRLHHPTLIGATCPYCTHSFKTHDQLAHHVRSQHTQDEHACPCCMESFSTSIRLARHIHAHHPPPAPPTDTPIDVFFQAYQTQYHFTYDRSSPPSIQFNRLRKFLRLEGTQLDQIRAKYGSAMRAEVTLWFGGTEFHATHLYYRAVGVRQVKYSIASFVRDFRGKHVNLIDMVHWARHEGSDGETVSLFDDKEELIEYSKRHAKSFPAEYVLGSDSGLEGNSVSRRLLSNVGHRPICVEDGGWQIPEKLATDSPDQTKPLFISIWPKQG